MSLRLTRFCCQMESTEVYQADRAATSDLEAAQTLAELARCSAVRGGNRQTVDERGATFSSQDQAIPGPQFCGSTAIVTGVLETNETDIVPNQLCTTSCHSNSTKLKQNFTEAEKEERKLRRILANRESARQTIRRRKAIHLEFTKKVAELAEVNESLKREKGLALKKHDSLKDTNGSLKLLISKLKKGNSRRAQEEPKVSEETTSSVNSCTPFLPYNQPLFVPLFVPSAVQSPDLLQFQNASHPEVSCSLQFPMRPYGTPFVHPGQEGSTGSRDPVFILPVPLLLPCAGHCNVRNPHSQASKRPREAPAAHQHIALSSDHHQISSNQCVGTTSRTGLTFQADSGELPTGLESVRDDPSKNSSLEHIPQSFSTKKNPISHRKKSGNVIAASEARQRRKELMRLKNIRFHHSDFMQ